MKLPFFGETEAVLFGLDRKVPLTGELRHIADGMAEKLGVEAEFFSAPGRAPNAFATNLFGTPQVVVTDGIRDLFHHSAMNGEAALEAIVGHELGHVKQGLTNVMGAQLAAAVLVGYGAEKAFRSLFAPLAMPPLNGAIAKKDAKGETMLTPYREPDWQARLRKAVYVTGANLVGVSGILMGTNLVSRYLEFNADRVGAELAGTEAMQDALRTLHQHQKGAENLLQGLSDAQIEAIKGDPVRKVNEVLQWLQPFSTHPSHEARAAHLDRVAAKVAAQGRPLSFVEGVMHDGLATLRLAKALL